MRASPNAPRAPVAVLYQALDPPLVDGARKPAREGGYADSGADIAWALRSMGIDVVTPGAAPGPSEDSGWSWPDTAQGIAAALAAGARVLWANVHVHPGHPLERVPAGTAVVGQLPSLAWRYDDKWKAREVLAGAGLPVPRAIVTDASTGTRDERLRRMAAEGIGWPAVVKPLRGRGSQGVSRVDGPEALESALAALAGATAPGPEGNVPMYGSRALVEEFLSGDEITVTVLPPGTYLLGGIAARMERHWALPPVAREGHDRGIAPYSGVVAVARNSAAMEPKAASAPDIAAALAACEEAGSLVGARAAIRIDCRRSQGGRMMLFDVNLKPNLTGPGRPGREGAESLVAMAGRAAGWSYPGMMVELLRQAWVA